MQLAREPEERLRSNVMMHASLPSLPGANQPVQRGVRTKLPAEEYPDVLGKLDGAPGPHAPLHPTPSKGDDPQQRTFPARKLQPAPLDAE